MLSCIYPAPASAIHTSARLFESTVDSGSGVVKVDAVVVHDESSVSYEQVGGELEGELRRALFALEKAALLGAGDQLFHTL